jgi:hypothetical protein
MARRQKEKPESWLARIGPDGWAAVSQHAAGGGQPGLQVLVRVRADEAGRYRIHELHLFPTDEPITAERLRAVRVGAIEQLLNLPDEHEAIAARIDESEPSQLFEAFMEKFLATQLTPAYSGGGVHRAPASKLSAPRGRGYGDEFYERVATSYRDALRRGERPVEALRLEANVPRSTAARWVKEARRRGLLGQAPAPGKAGA